MNYICTPASRSKWLSIASTCPYATYFHTPYWYELMVPGQDYKAIEVNFDDGVSALIPIAKIKRAGGLLADHFSSPGGTYGGWISASPLEQEHVKVLINILVSKKNLTYRVNPFFADTAGINSVCSMRSPAVKFTEDFTHIIDLTNGIDGFYRGMTRCHRKAVRSAVRNGLTAKIAENWEEWERYYDIYEDTVKRWRAAGANPRTVYPRALFERFYRNLTGNENLWLTYKDGEIIAGILFFYWGKRFVGWHGASSAAHFRYRPNNLLCWEAVTDAIRKGYTLFDFNPSGGYGGVESFKESFGAVSVASPVLYTRTPVRRLLARLR